MKFFDEASGATLRMDRYYGFGDAGGLAGSFEGYESVEAAKQAIAPEHGYLEEEIASEPELLGAVAICVLSGQQYVDQLQKAEPGNLRIFGYFVD
jgi:hypothetical protein